MFVFDSEGSSDAIEGTAEAQLQDTNTGAATDEDALDPPAASGD